MIHYKFKGTKTWDRVSSDEPFFNVLNFKREINKRTRSISDLRIVDAISGESYNQDGYLLPRNARIIVRRIPATKKSLQACLTEATQVVEAQICDQNSCSEKDVENKDNIAEMNKKQEEEEAKMLCVLNKAAQYKSSCNHFTAAAVTSSEGSGGMHEFRKTTMKHGREHSVPSNHYICNRCGQRGHFIRCCPTNGNSDFDLYNPRRATGIPRKFLKIMSPEEVASTSDLDEKEHAQNGDKVMLESEENGQKISTFYRASANNDDFQRFFRKEASEQDQPIQTPVHLLCALCKRIHRDAVTLKCCFTSFCMECIHQKLATDSSTCPICGLEVSSEELVANEGIRKLVRENLQHCVL